MSLPIENLTPRQIVAELDKYIIGQDAAKRAVAIALRNRFRRQHLPADQREDVLPKNILMMGPTGVGKTEIARRLAQLARAPFVKVEATKFTEVGYVGRDVDAMVRDLVAAAVRLVEKERMEEVRPRAEEGAWERIADLISYADEPSQFAGFGFRVHDSEEEEVDWAAQEQARLEKRSKLLEEVKAGRHRDRVIEFDVEEPGSPFVQVFSPQGVEEMGLDMPGGGPFGSKRTTRKATVGDAYDILVEEEARKLIDRMGVQREAIIRTEQTGIIFIDEIDKVAIKSSGGSGPDVSREGVQRDLLPIIEGSTVQTKFGPVRTDHILFIAAGAFHVSKPSDLIPELQGRLPIRVELDSLSETDFRRILREPRNALTTQYERMLSVEGFEIGFTAEALDAIAHFASELNLKIENIGARRLHTVMEKLLEIELFEAPEGGPRKIQFTAEMVEDRLAKFVRDIGVARKVL